MILVSRIFASPEFTKELYKVLKDQIEKYESKYGEIILEKKLSEKKLQKIKWKRKK